MATTYVRIDRDVQVSEATTVRRNMQYSAGAAEAQTYTVRKADGGTTFGAPGTGGTINNIMGTLYELTPAAADLDTEGNVVFKCTGSTAETVLYGVRVVQHDPFADVAAILADTGTDGVAIASGAITAAKIGTGALTSDKFAVGAITPLKFSSYVNEMGGVQYQVNETTTTKRVLLYNVGAAEAQTITVIKNGASPVASASTSAQVSGNLYKLTIAAGDVDTLGGVAWLSQGTSGTVAINGVSIVAHDPQEDLNYVARNGGKGLLIYDTTAGTIKTYDGSTTSATLLGTQTRTTSATEVKWTPS